jgi:restriction system protein
MVLPTHTSIELPLLKVLSDNRDQLTAAEAIDSVTKYFPQITPDDLTKEMNSPWGGSFWRNRVRWARQALVGRGQIDDSVRGVWKLTDEGKSRLKREWSSWKPKYQEKGSITTTPKLIHEAQSALTTLDRPPDEILVSTLNLVRDDLAAQILRHLLVLAPSSFEMLCGQLLEKMGYGNVKLKGGPGDEGIDGTCSVDALGLYKVHFQAKRWKGSVPPKEIRDFVGGMDMKRYQFGIFVTTSNFTRDAVDAAERSGKVKLVDGQELAKLMIKYGLGVSKTPYELPRIDQDFFESI